MDDIHEWLHLHGVSFCDFAYDLNGVLTDQSSYYQASYAEMQYGLQLRAGEIADALT